MNKMENSRSSPWTGREEEGVGGDGRRGSGRQEEGAGRERRKWEGRGREECLDIGSCTVVW